MSLRVSLRPWRLGQRLLNNRALHTKPPPFPIVPTCPSPTCECAATPTMPEGLPIDHEGKLNGLISNYAEQVLICTGKDDWPSRIEDDNSGDNLAADLKELFGRGGVYSDPFHNISVLNASFPPSSPPPTPTPTPTPTATPNTPTRTRYPPGLATASAYLLPSFRYVPLLPRVSFDSVDALARGYLLPARLHPAHDGLLSPVHRDRLTRQPAYRALLPGVRKVGDVLVLVCGHGGRDARCGVAGPVLRAEFEARLPRAGVEVRRGPVEVVLDDEVGDDDDAAGGLAAGDGDDESVGVAATATVAAEAGLTARVGLISHIGGHKFAGNVIIYLPPSMRRRDGGAHPLAGHGVWYGRVEPKHVEGIVQETVINGNVIADMFRGGITPDRQILRL